jgi:hypothetical protein
MFGAGCFIYSGRTYTTDLQSRLTRFRPMVLCVANILLSVDASIAQRQGVSPADYQHELESAHSRNNGCRGLKVLLAAVSLTSYKVTCV